ncbi:MAG: hypothetical protein JST79_07335 [Acidobacteria bacterium]|nr:hypothetical protein [Acidobacteriota bacterium]
MFRNRYGRNFLGKGAGCMALGVLGLVLSAASAGAQSTDTPAGGAQSSPAQDTPPAAQAEANLPLSGVDQPNLGSGLGSRSYLIPALHVSEGIDTNVNDSGDSSIYGVTRVLGSLSLQKLWNRSSMGLDYVGGGAFYSNSGIGASQVHELSFEHHYLWKTGQIGVRDSFSYLPEGAFGYGAFGGLGGLSGVDGGTGGLGGVTGGLGGTSLGFFGPGQFATLGQQENISNVTIADITQELSPRSAVTFAGSYGLIHFLNNPQGYIDSRQTSFQAGYNYQLNRRDQVAVLYGFQSFRYPDITGTHFETHLWHVMYGHRVSGRMDLTLGGGPQLTRIDSPLLGASTRLSMSGRAALRYRFKRASASVSYDRYNTSGSGFYTGANTDLARFSVTREMGRLWHVDGNVGYTRSSELIGAYSAVNGNSYDYWYAGGAISRQLGRDFTVVASYQYNRLGFSNCPIGGPACEAGANRHVALVGLTWHPRPVRLD